MAGERRALVIEDDEELRALVSLLLRQAGFVVADAPDGATGLGRLAAHDPDLVTLDLNLPDLDGIEVCRRIRQSSDAYVIMLTGRPDEIDRLIGLETGADDYLTKPFSPRELTARVAAMMRRPRRRAADDRPATPVDDGGHEVLRHDGLIIDVDARVCRLEGTELALTRIEFDLLVVLARSPRRVWSKESLLRAVWETEWAGDPHLVEVHVGNVRRKLGPGWIRTVRGVGYRLSGEA